MGAIGDKFNEVYRDYATDGVTASGPYNPEKAAQREIGALIEAGLATASLGGLVDIAYATRAELEADLAHEAASVGLVYSDPVDANNDLYTKSGASGAGAWALTSAIHSAIATQAQTFVDAVEAAAATVRYSAGVFLTETQGIFEGGYPADLYAISPATIDRVRVSVEEGTGSFDATVLVNEVVVSGPVTATGNQPATVVVPDIGIAEGAKVSIAIHNLSGEVTSAFAQIDGVLG